MNPRQLFQEQHPITRISLAGFFLAAGLVLRETGLLLIFFTVIILPISYLAGVLPSLVRQVIKLTIPFAISMFLIQGFLWPGGTALFHLGPLALKTEGIRFAADSTARIVVISSGFLWLSLTTRPDLLMTALVQKGVPASLAYIVVATLQIAPRFQARAASILEAQQARGLEINGHILKRIRAVLPMVVPLVLSSLVDAEERALAVEARAFSAPGPKTSLVEIREAGWEFPFRVSLLSTIIILLLLRILL